MIGTVDDDGRIVGRCTLPALRALASPRVAAAFARVAAAFADDGPFDAVDVATVDRAHAVRVAVAVRWAAAGASAAERRAAARVDRALQPHGHALLASPDGDGDADWLRHAWLEGADIDLDAWWGLPLRLELDVPHDAVVAALAELAAEERRQAAQRVPRTDYYRNPPHATAAELALLPRHEGAWHVDATAPVADHFEGAPIWRQVAIVRAEDEDWALEQWAERLHERLRPDEQ